MKNCIICRRVINRAKNKKTSKLRRGNYAITCSKECSKQYQRISNYICRKYWNYINFAKEIKKLIRESGKTNFITPQQIEQLIVEYNIK